MLLLVLPETTQLRLHDFVNFAECELRISFSEQFGYFAEGEDLTSLRSFADVLVNFFE